jgi:hypothetical protein
MVERILSFVSFLLVAAMAAYLFFCAGYREVPMEVRRGSTLDGVEVVYTAEDGKALVEFSCGNVRLRFHFNPDFPADAGAFFEALLLVREVIVVQSEEDA